MIALLAALLLAAPAASAPRALLSPGGPTWLGVLTPASHPRVLQGRCLVMVDPDDGSLWVEQTDIDVPGEEPPISVVRRWSADGWRTSLDDRLVETAAGVAIQLMDETWTASTARVRDQGVAWPIGTLFAGEGLDVERTSEGWAVTRGGLAETYDADGWLLTRRYPSGATLRHTRQDGKLKEVESSDGRHLQVFHDAAGNVSLIVAGEGVEVYYDYVDGALRAVSSSAQGRTRHIYGEDGQLKGMLWPDGSGVNIRRDERGRVISLTGPGPLRQNLTWTEQGLRADASSGGALQVVRRQREGGQLQEAVTDGSGRSVRTTWTPDGASSWEDPRGTTWLLDRDDAGRLVALTGPGGATWRFGYGENGLTLLIDPAGGRWTYRRDAGGHTVAVVDPTGREVGYPRDSNGRITAVNRGASTTRIQRDLRGQVIGLQSSDGARTAIRRDALGRVVGVVDPSGNELKLSNHRGAQAGSLSNREQHLWSLRFDALGRPTRLEGPGKGALVIRRSALGRATWIGDKAGDGTRYGYRSDGRLTLFEDALGAATGLLYDPSGRLRALRRADLTEIEIDRDAAGEITALRSGKVEITIPRTTLGRPLSAGPLRWTWDTLGRLTGVLGEGLQLLLDRGGDGAVKALTLGDDEIVFSRDAAGRVIGAEREGETLRLERSSSGLVTLIALNEDPPVTLDRDSRGLITVVTESGRTWRVLRDGEGHPLRWIAPDGTPLSGPRDREGRPTLVRYPDGTLARIKWAPDKVEWSLEDADGYLLATRLVELDALGRPARVDEDDHTTWIRRDALGRVVARESEEGTWSRTEDIVANTADGSLVTLDEAGLPAEVRPPFGPEAWGIAHESLSYMRDALGRVVTLMGDALDLHLSWDAAGRLVSVTEPSGEGWRIEWDLLGRPAAFQDPDGEWTILSYHDTGLLSWRSEADGLVDVVHADGWGWLLSGSLPRLLVADESGDPRAWGYQGLESLGWSPAGFPAQEWGVPLSWSGALNLFSGGPLLDAAGAWDPASGSWLDRPLLFPWTAPPEPTGQLAAVDGTATPWWDPGVLPPTSPWSDPLALLVTLGELEPALEGDWLVVDPEAPPLGWLPAAAARPAPPLCPPAGALPLDMSGLPLVALAVRSSLSPTAPITSDSIVDALSAVEFGELEPLPFLGRGLRDERPWWPSSAPLK